MPGKHDIRMHDGIVSNDFPAVVALMQVKFVFITNPSVSAAAAGGHLAVL
jgi:hypothetical protein